MPSPVTPLFKPPVHQDDVVSGVTPKKLEALRQESKSLAAVSPAQSTPQPRPVQPQMTVALSFAFDSLTQSLNVIMTDKNSGEAVRKISYKSLPIDVHKAEKLNGLLLDQFA